MASPTNDASASNSVSTMIMLGGICAGSGIMTLLFGFEPEGGADFAEQISTIGFNGIPAVTITSFGWIGFGLLGVGVALMVAGNSRAWKSTGGY